MSDRFPAAAGLIKQVNGLEKSWMNLLECLAPLEKCFAPVIYPEVCLLNEYISLPVRPSVVFSLSSPLTSASLHPSHNSFSTASRVCAYGKQKRARGLPQAQMNTVNTGVRVQALPNNPHPSGQLMYLIRSVLAVCKNICTILIRMHVCVCKCVLVTQISVLLVCIHIRTCNVYLCV